ncbi:methyltransferase domain-containing protein [Agromyces neolithicus]|uniref:Arsenite methyltransferase n=1 Tax=Agromyces neolithicus TaxID=269420 RepID=A0ABN2LX45_9MICO
MRETNVQTDGLTVGVGILDVEDLRRRVRQVYRDVAIHPEQGFHFETGRALAERLGYPPEELDAIPAGAIESFAGVGYPLNLAGIRAGESVLDLGSGSGMDSMLAGRQVGPAGRVLGVDLTREQFAKAARLAADAGLPQVEFRFGSIEHLEIDDQCIDVVVSNGAINLAVDKLAVFAEAARVLRPGGRLALADIVSERRLPERVVCDASLWASCIGGAAKRDDYMATIVDAGFTIETLRENQQYRFLSGRAIDAAERWGVTSISLLAVRNPHATSVRS